jgi:hypothetical protein
VVETATPAGERIAAELVSARRGRSWGGMAELAAFLAALRERDSTIVWHVHYAGRIGSRLFQPEPRPRPPVRLVRRADQHLAGTTETGNPKPAYR